MGMRRKARELALQILYQMEIKGTDPKGVLAFFGKTHDDTPPEVLEFATQIVEGAYRNRREIDELIEKHSTHWRMPRMAVVDRNILRLGVYELLYLHEVPTSVALNEAIEVAKKFGTENSSSFINGILDNVAKEVRKIA